MELSELEKERYNRHLIIKEFGLESQLKLKKGRVLVIGAGGLGCPVVQYLVAAGVGVVDIVDKDVVSLSNLQRQILYTEDEIGFSKSTLLASKMRKLNSNVSITVFDEFLTEELAATIFNQYDVVVGCTDSFSTRYLIDKWSIHAGIPFVYGAIREYEGQLCVFNVAGGKSYADVFKVQPADLLQPGGVIGAIPGIIGSLMAMEVIKIVSGKGVLQSQKLLLFNGLENSFYQISI